MRRSPVRRLARVTIAAVVALLLLGTLATTAGIARSRAEVRWNQLAGHGASGRHAPLHVDRVWKKLVLREVFGEDFTPIDVGEPGDSIGDYGVFRDKIASDRTGRIIGTIDVQCISAYADQCRGSISLDGRGQITFDGITPLDVDPDEFAVTGGTGDFLGVGGQLRVEFPNDEYALLTLWLTK